MSNGPRLSMCFQSGGKRRIDVPADGQDQDRNAFRFEPPAQIVLWPARVFQQNHCGFHAERAHSRQQRQKMGFRAGDADGF